LVIFRSLPPRKDRNTDELRQASLRKPIEKSTAGASLLAQIIVGKFASYLLIDGATLSIRRVEYDIEREIKVLGQSGLPRADWIAKTLLAAAPQMP
jgi:hypothetical protein